MHITVILSPKDEEFNSRGSPRGSFRDPRIFWCQILLEKLDRFIDEVMLSHFGVRFSRLKVVLGDLKVKSRLNCCCRLKFYIRQRPVGLSLLKILL